MDKIALQALIKSNQQDLLTSSQLRTELAFEDSEAAQSQYKTTELVRILTITTLVSRWRLSKYYALEPRVVLTHVGLTDRGVISACLAGQSCGQHAQHPGVPPDAYGIWRFPCQLVRFSGVSTMGPSRMSTPGEVFRLLQVHHCRIALHGTQRERSWSWAYYGPRGLKIAQPWDRLGPWTRFFPDELPENCFNAQPSVEVSHGSRTRP